MSIRTIERLHQRFVEEGLEAALKRRPGGSRKRKLDGEVEAHLIALCCSKVPQGKARSSLYFAKQVITIERRYIAIPNCIWFDNCPDLNCKHLELGVSAIRRSMGMTISS